MKQIKTILQKEFLIFFNSAIGYVFLTVFLGFSGWMFFRTFFLMGQVDLRGFFTFLPWSFLFLIPAFTMRSWSEEFRSGTIETLLTSGTSIVKTVLAKFLTLFLFLSLALTLTIPFAITISFLGNLDWGVVWISYLGALMLGSSYVAIGLFVSAITKNQIVAFLLSIIICFMFYALGEGFVTIFLSGFLGEIFHNLGLGTHFKSMIRGVIDSRDILFYLSFISVFVLANVAVLSGKFWPRVYFWKIAVAGALIVSILLNIGGQFVFARFDGTEDDNYTLSVSSKNILKNLQKPVSVKAFISQNIPAQVQSVSRDIRDILDEYSARGAGNISLEILNPMKDDTALNWAQNFGVHPLQLQIIERDKRQVVKAYLGIVVTTENTDKEGFTERFEKYETLPVITKMNDFEYQLSSAIKKVSAEKLSVIGFLTDNGTKKLGNLKSQFAFGGNENMDEIPMRDILKKNYDIREISLSDENFDDEITEIKTIIIAGPADSFSDDEATKIKKILAEGKNIILMADKIQVFGSFTQNSPANFDNILGEFGLSLKTSLVADAINESVGFSTGMFQVVRPYPFWVKSVDLSAENPITKDIPSLSFPWISPVDISGKEGVEIEVLAWTSPYFTEFPGEKMTQVPVEVPEESEEPENESDTPEEDVSADSGVEKEQKTEQVLIDAMISLDPEQDFGFSRIKKDPLPLAVIARKQGGGKLLFIPNTRFVTREFSENFSENLVFLNNAIDIFTIGDELVSIRSKQISDRPIAVVTNGVKSAIRWINILLMPFIVIIFGFFRRYLRNKKKTLF